MRGVGRIYRRSGRDQEALPEVREGLGGPYKGPGVVGRPSWKAKKGREALP